MTNNNSYPIPHTASIKLWLCLAALLLPIAAEANLIMIEPDDYVEGADLSRVSPYVTLIGFNGASVYATPPRFEFPAPTGKLTFGSFAHVGEPAGDGSCFQGVESSTNGICHVGLGLFFHQPVNWVSLHAINSGYSLGLNVQWDAFDKSGEKITYGFESGDSPDNYGRPFDFKVGVPNMTALIVGGSTGIDAMEFDQLIFQVPEPAPLYMYAMGLMALMLFKLRKHRRSAN